VRHATVVPERPPPPQWYSLLSTNLEGNLMRMGYGPNDMQWRWAFDDLENGWPYGIILGALEATLQRPPIPYSLAKVNQAHVALELLEELRRTDVI
jgi:hypothetical protein